MRLVPSRRARWVLLGIGAAVLATFPLWNGPVRDLIDDLREDRIYNKASGRTSDAAPVGDALALPAVAAAPEPTGTDPAIAVEEVVALPSASSAADPPGDGPILVTTLDGMVHAVELATGGVEPALDLTGAVSTGMERGLLGIAVDEPGDRVYLNYTNLDGDTEVRSWPLEDGLPAGTADDGVLHLQVGQPFPNHNGGNLVFGPDGALWIGLGDGGSGGDPGNVAQDPSWLLGKMLRVVPLADGGVEAPSTNPDWDGRPEVWGIGLRNPWRYSFDRATNRLWIADVGQAEVEEVTVVDPAADRSNFGWDAVEGDQPFEGEPSSDFLDPVVTYTHDDGCSITGGYVYRGASIPGLHGWYLFADYCGGWLRAVPADAPEQAPEELLADLGNVISFAELEDGELLLLTADGVRRIVAAGD